MCAPGFIFQTDFKWGLVVRLKKPKIRKKKKKNKGNEWENRTISFPIKAIKVPIGKI